MSKTTTSAVPKNLEEFAASFDHHASTLTGHGARIFQTLAALYASGNEFLPPIGDLASIPTRHANHFRSAAVTLRKTAKSFTNADTGGLPSPRPSGTVSIPPRPTPKNPCPVVTTNGFTGIGVVCGPDGHPIPPSGTKPPPPTTIPPRSQPTLPPRVDPKNPCKPILLGGILGSMTTCDPVSRSGIVTADANADDGGETQDETVTTTTSAPTTTAPGGKRGPGGKISDDEMDNATEALTEAEKEAVRNKQEGKVFDRELFTKATSKLNTSQKYDAARNMRKKRGQPQRRGK